MPNQLWILYALLGALFAGVVQVMSKPAGDKLGPNLISLIRAAVAFVFFVAFLAWTWHATGKVLDPKLKPDGSPATSIRSQTAIILAVGGGVASALSWLFGYAALRLSAVANSYSLDKLSLLFGVVLAVIFLGERPSIPNYLGVVLMLGGAYLVTLKPA